MAFEAEDASSLVGQTISGTAYAWGQQTDIAGFGGAGFLQALPNDGMVVDAAWPATSAEARYTVTFANPGTYHVWLRGYASTAENASVYVGLNGASPVAARIDLGKTGAWTWSNAAAGSDVPVSVTVSSAGSHTLNIWMRDAGFALDRILLTRNPNYSAEYNVDFWRRQSIYQIVTDRFFDGDPSNNTLSPNFSPATGNRAHGGDLRGVERKLDYIKALGATAIWISPVLLNGTGDYHGYGASDFYKTDPRMGTMADLQRLVREAHRRGILVINDVVVNHGTTWVDSAESGWAAFRYPPSGYTLRYNSGGRAYAAPFDNASLTAAFGNTALTNIFNNNGATQNWGDATQVELGELSSLDDFRTQSPYVRQRMREIWTWWITNAGFDAYRLDTVKHVEMGFWDDWCPAVRAAAEEEDKPNFFQFGEIYDGSDSKVGSYTGSKTSGVYKMESALDYPLYYQMGSVFATATGSTGQIENRYNNLTTANYDASALNSLVLNLDNHDQPRFLNAAGSTTARLDLALVFLLTSRGIPSLYYGTEQDFNGGADPANREDMFDGQYESGPSLGDNFNMTSPRFRRVAMLNNFRRLYPALQTGAHVNLWADWQGPGLFAYARRLGTQEVVVILNTATSDRTIAARPTIHPAGTVLVNLLNPAETLTVTAGTDGIPPVTVPGTSAKMFVAQSQVRPLSPVVTAVSPAHDAAGVSPSTAVTLTFSRAMDSASVEAAFSTVPASTGSFSWSAGGTVLTYMPSSNFAAATLHAVVLADTAADATGLRLHAPFESRFTTGAASSLSRPSINSLSASAIGDSTATLEATVTPNGAATSVVFEYGTTTSYGAATSQQAAGAGNSPVGVSTLLGGLQANTTYHYRAVATNSQGSTASADRTFTTAALLPETTTTAASFVTATSANVNGTVNPKGLPTTVRFDYGLQPNILTESTPWQDAGSAAGNQDRWAFLSGLTPDTTYFYQIVAETAGGTVRGAVESFHTLAIKPTFTSVGVSDVGTGGATLTAVASANGSDSSVWFEYGTNTSFGSATPPQSLPGAAVNADISAVLGGLVAGRTYVFRGVASNVHGTTFSPSQSFTSGFAPPLATTAGAGPVTQTNATVAGWVNPRGRPTGYWVEYGTSTNYGSTTQRGASDNAEAYASFGYAATNNSGGTGFGVWTGHVTNSGNSRGRLVLVTSSSINGTAGRMTDGAKSFGVTAGTSTTQGTQSGYRTFSAPRQAGTFSFAMRCDVNNSTGFTGLNLKSQGGTSFGSGELVSIGMMPSNGAVGGNTGLVLTDAAGQRMIDFAAEVRGGIFDVQIDFDTRTGDYTLRVKQRADTVFRTLTGKLKLSGATVNAAAFGFLNANNSGATNQNLIFDNLSLLGRDSAGDGTADLPVTQILSGLPTGAVIHYRLAAASSAGTNYGVNRTFVTGSDFALGKSPVGTFRQGGTGQFQLTVTNAGGVAGSGPVTIAETPDPGMTVTSMSGDGWVHDAASSTCSRSDALPPGAAYPPIAVTVAIATNAPATLTNTAALSGGGDANPANNAASASVPVAPALSPIEAWRQSRFGDPADTGVGADTNSAANDGMANLVKYALGLDPALPAAGTEVPRISRSGDRLRLVFRRAAEATDVTLRVEASGSLAGGWNETIWSSATNSYGGGTNAVETVTVEDWLPIGESPSGQRYLRLRVTRP